MKTALVVTTYNNPRALGICLRSLAAQTERQFDLFVADDGSASETKDKIESFRSEFGKLEHVWHPDNGYNKTKINNEVFRRLRAYEVIICVDGDTFVHPDFVRDHLQVHRAHAGEKVLFMGRRVDLDAATTEWLTEENAAGFAAGPSFKLIWSGLMGRTRNAGRAWRIASPWLQRLLKRDQVHDLLGSNFSVTASLLFEVNGYDEDYRSYWGEDGDLFIRLRNAGAKLVGLKSFAIQYHLHHPRLEPDKDSQMRYQSMLQNREYRRCRNGIEK